MSCFFCNSFYHLSQDCDIYVSDESRKVFARLKKCCELCLTPIHRRHHFPTCGEYDYERKGLLNRLRKLKAETLYNLNLSKIPYEATVFRGPSECQSKLRCLICYSKNHYSVFCPERSKPPALFLPNIDFDLIKRFLQILDEFDQFLLRCRYPILSNLVTLRPFKLTPYTTLKRYYEYIKDPRSYVFIGNFKFQNFPSNHYCRTIFSERIRSDITADKSAIINIDRVVAPLEMILSFLTFNTKILQCSNCYFSPSLPIEDIFKTAPNIQIIEFAYANIVLENGWPENLLKYKNGSNFKKLTATIRDFNFCEKALANFMIEKCEKNVEIVFRYYVGEEDFQNIHKNLLQKFLQYFDPFDSKKHQTPHLSIFLTEKYQYFMYHFQCLNFTLKEFK